MPRSLDAPLSPRDEIALRRVALGIDKSRDLSQQDLQRLRKVLRVADNHGRPELTTLGRKRYYALP